MGKLLDSMQNYFENGSKEQFLRDWEELKHLNEIGPDILEVINGYKPQQSLFTLTAEEVEDYKIFLEHSVKWNCGATNFDEIILNTKRVKTLNRIRQWQETLK